MILEKTFFNWPITNQNCLWCPYRLTRNIKTLNSISHTSFLQSNYSLCLLVSEEKSFSISANQKQLFAMATMFFVQMGWDEMTISDRRSSIDATCWISIYLAKQFQKETFRNRVTRNKKLSMATMFVKGSGRSEQPV